MTETEAKKKNKYAWLVVHYGNGIKCRHENTVSSLGRETKGMVVCNKYDNVWGNWFL